MYQVKEKGLKILIKITIILFNYFDYLTQSNLIKSK